MANTKKDTESIQGLIEKAIFCVTGEQRRVIGAGRTDAGVHARGPSSSRNHRAGRSNLLPSCVPSTLGYHMKSAFFMLRRLLPISMRRSQPLERNTTITSALTMFVLPFEHPFVWHYRKAIDLELLEEAAQRFIGQHDFRGFSNAIGGGLIKHNTVRTLSRLDIVPTKTGLILKFFWKWVSTDGTQYHRYVAQRCFSKKKTLRH